jgi:putative transposase
MGLVIAIVVHAANIQDRDGAKLVMARLLGWFPRLKLIWADGGWVLEIVKRTDDVKGFKLLPHRWVVERALSEVEGSAGSGGTGGTARTTST